MQTAQALERLEALYANYCETADRLDHSRKLGAGMFGLPGGPADDPCHLRFREDVGALLAQFAADGPDPASVREVLAFLFERPLRSAAPKSAFWMLIAVQALAKELIPMLAPADAQALAARFKELYPRRARLPVQDEILKLLQNAGK